MYYYFVINGREDKIKKLTSLREELKNIPSDIAYEVYTTTAHKDATRFVTYKCEEKPDEEACFVACGGDGTINEVATALVQRRNKYLAVMPYGTGNDFVKYYNLREFKKVSSLLDGVVKVIDILKVNDAYSINVCNFGFDAQVCSYANKLSGKHRKNAYTKGIIHALINGRHNKINVWVDGEKISGEEMLLCTLANCHYVGGTYLCAPRASNRDGVIDVCLVKSLSIVKLISLMPSYIKGTHLDNPRIMKDMIYRQASHVDITSDDEIELCLDGEMLPGKKFSVDIIPGAINFIAPAKK